MITFIESEKANYYSNDLKKLKNFFYNFNYLESDLFINEIVKEITSNSNRKRDFQIKTAKIVFLFENRFNLQQYYSKIIAKIYLLSLDNTLFWTFKDFESEICSYILTNIDISKYNKVISELLNSLFSNSNAVPNAQILNFIKKNNPDILTSKYCQFHLDTYDYSNITGADLEKFLNFFTINLDFHNLEKLFFNLYLLTEKEDFYNWRYFYEKLSFTFKELSLKKYFEYTKPLISLIKFLKHQKKDYLLPFLNFLEYFLISDFSIEFFFENTSFESDINLKKTQLSKEKVSFLTDLINIYLNGDKLVSENNTSNYLYFLFRQQLDSINKVFLTNLKILEHKYFISNFSLTEIKSELPKYIVYNILDDILNCTPASKVIKKINDYDYFKSYQIKNDYSDNFKYKNKQRSIKFLHLLFEKINSLLVFKIIKFDFETGRGVLEKDSKLFSFSYVEVINKNSIGINFLSIDSNDHSIDISNLNSFMSYYVTLKQYENTLLKSTSNILSQDTFYNIISNSIDLSYNRYDFDNLLKPFYHSNSYVLKDLIFQLFNDFKLKRLAFLIDETFSDYQFGKNNCQCYSSFKKDSQLLYSSLI